MTWDRIYLRPKRPGNRMTRDQNNTASPPSMILTPPLPYPILPTTTQPPPLSYPPLPNHLTSSHLTPTSYPTSYCIIPYLLPFPIPSPYTPLPPPHNPYPPPPVLPYSPPALPFSTRFPLHTPITTNIYCPTLPAPVSLPCPTISHSVIPRPILTITTPYTSPPTNLSCQLPTLRLHQSSLPYPATEDRI